MTWLVIKKSVTEIFTLIEVSYLLELHRSLLSFFHLCQSWSSRYPVFSLNFKMTPEAEDQHKHKQGIFLLIISTHLWSNCNHVDSIQLISLNRSVSNKASVVTPSVKTSQSAAVPAFTSCCISYVTRTCRTRTYTIYFCKSCTYRTGICGVCIKFVAPRPWAARELAKLKQGFMGVLIPTSSSAEPTFSTVWINLNNGANPPASLGQIWHHLHMLGESLWIRKHNETNRRVIEANWGVEYESHS